MQNTSRVYGERLGCMVDKSYKLIECLRSRSFEELGNIRLTVYLMLLNALSVFFVLMISLFVNSLTSAFGRGVPLLTERFANQLATGMKAGKRRIGAFCQMCRKSLFGCASSILLCAIWPALRSTKLPTLFVSTVSFAQLLVTLKIASIHRQQQKPVAKFHHHGRIFRYEDSRIHTSKQLHVQSRRDLQSY